MSRLYIAKCPSFSDLEVFVVDLCGLEGNSGPPIQILKAKCRELARADSAILVSPTTESVNAPFGQKPSLSLWITAKKGYVDSTKCKQRLHQLIMKVVCRVPLSLSIIQACYQFTIMARLAPKWNKVASWLIKGSEFLTTGKAQVLNLEVGITIKEITLNLIVRKLSFNPLKVEDLNTTTTVLNTFKTNPQYVINETSICSNRCLLLPNLSVGYIFSASHQIPHSHDFPSYDKVRLHWKKQHGIILPETQDLFYQVFFKFNSGKFFSYPGSCVFKNQPLVFPSRETDLTAASFIADIHARIPTICGEPVKFLNKALITSAELHTATQSGTPNQTRFLNTVPVVPKNTYTSQLPRHHPTANQAIHLGTNPVNLQAKCNTSSALPTNPCIGQASTSVRMFPAFMSKLSSKPAIHKQPQSSRDVENRNDNAIVPSFKPKPKQQINSATAASSNQIFHVQSGKSLNERSQPPPPKRPCFTASLSQSNKTSNNNTATSHVQSSVLVTPRNMPTQQTVPDLNKSLGSIGPQELSFVSPRPKPTQKQAKPRGKSTGPPKEQIQVEGVSNDIMNKIHKSKAQVLKKWLQENGLKYRSKDKKDDLARMVAIHIAQTGKTFELVSS